MCFLLLALLIMQWWKMRTKMKMRKSEKGICECVKINDFLPIPFPGFVDYAMIEDKKNNEIHCLHCLNIKTAETIACIPVYVVREG